MNSRLQSARIALFLCGCAAFLNLYSTQSIPSVMKDCAQLLQ
ncbi:MAG TPA: hypothetical protein VJ889_22965 [Pseudomonas sp.]|nr:hypothetical protein [Pseudomonas sp.]